MRRWVAVTALLIMACAGAGAATYYVATDGNDANPGTVDAPFLTPKKALVDTVLVDGDLVVFRQGTYQMKLVRPAVRPDAQDYVTIMSYPGERALLNSSATYGAWEVRDALGRDRFWKFVNLDFTGPKGFNTEYHCEDIWFEDCNFVNCLYGIRNASGTLPKNWTIKNCTFADCRIGINAGGVENILIEDCSGTGRWPAELTPDNTDGVMISGTGSCIVRRCTFNGYSDGAYDIKHDGALITDCIGFGNGNQGFKIWGQGSVITNCLAYGNTYSGFLLAANGKRMVNCTSAGNGTDAVRPQSSAGYGDKLQLATVFVENCLFVGRIQNYLGDSLWNSDRTCYWMPGVASDTIWWHGDNINLRWSELLAGLVTFTRSLCADPQLGADWLPMPGSPAVGYGYGGALVLPPADPPPVEPPPGPSLTPEDRQTLDELRELLNTLKALFGGQ